MWDLLQAQKRIGTNRRGFTIVELLVVIVVIGILAAITIVSFNGVQNRARQSAAQQLVVLANKKVIAYAVLNADMYPVDLVTAGMPNNDGLQYSYNNSASPRTYGITATNGSVSYYMSSTVTQPTTGGYVGHGANGATAITNLATNPGFENLSAGANSYNANNTYLTSGGYAGPRFLRATRSVTSGSSGPWFNAAVIEPGKTYTVTIAIRSNVTAVREINIEWINAANSAMISRSVIATITPTSSWVLYSGSATAPVGSANLRLAMYTPTSSTGALTDYADFDATMITEGTTQYAYADGNTANWIWNGSQDGSTSTGSPL